MGALAAVVNKKGRDAIKPLVAMLKVLKHKGAEAFGVASSTDIRIEESIESLRNQTINSCIGIGHVFSQIQTSDKPQPLRLNDAALIFEGRIYPPDLRVSDAEFAAEKLDRNRELGARNLIKDLEGDFVFTIAEGERIVAGRDSLGVYPLYYGENVDFAVLASTRKAIWKTGIATVISFPPGHTVVIDKHGFRFKTARMLTYTGTKKTTMQEGAKKLQKLLKRSARERVAGLRDVAVSFSGGLDSSITAFLAEDSGANVHLVNVSLKRQPETEYAIEAAEALNLPLHTYSYDDRDVEKTIPKVLKIIEESNPINASIGVPVFWTAEKVSEMGFKVMLAGQGADELFGGYKRYLNDYRRYGKEFVQKTIFADITRMHETNFERDSKICNFHNVELRLPFATYELAKFAVGLPLDSKIGSPNDDSRKLVLRRASENIGLPILIVNRPKKAIQYATGVTKVMKKLARQQDLSVKEYIEEMFKSTL